LRLIAEFEEQGFTQIVFPHKETDWKIYLDEAQESFKNIINTIATFQPCLVITDDINETKKFFENIKNIFFIEYCCDDTWARDTSVLCRKNEGSIDLLDFRFTAWGGKYNASKDDKMNQSLKKHYDKDMLSIDFILEGGGIESNGKNLLISTKNCMLNQNRNSTLKESEITKEIESLFLKQKLLYLEHGYLSGDDTDSHIDTLVRFISEDTLMYVKCNDVADEHYAELSAMEAELFIIAKEYHLRLIPLPMTEAIYYEDERLPATYANFLFVNGGVIVPTYGVKEDKEALEIFRKSFKDRKIIGVDSSVLIRQHGSLHCISMNFAKGVSFDL